MVPLYCLIVVMFIPSFLALGSIPFRVIQEKYPDIQKPREQAARLTGAGARIVHAQSNSWEALILFAVTLFIAYQMGVSAEHIAVPSIAFVLIRLVYTVFYLLGFGVMRFLSFSLGMASLIWILVLSF